MMRSFLAGTALAAILALSPGQASAQLSTFCVNCTQEVKDVIRWAESLANQAQQISNQIQSIQWLISNTISLPERLFADLMSPVWQAQMLVNQARMLGENTRFMILNLSHPSGYGGSLEDIPLALAQENNALSRAMQQLGMVHDQVNAITTACIQQYRNIDDGSAGAGGIKSATQAGNSIGATAGQCAEARAQFQIAAANAAATAQLRIANRQALIDAASQSHLQSAIGAGCASLSAGGGSSWVCQQAQSPGPAGGAAVAVGGSGTPIPSGGNISDAQAAAINAAPNTPSGGNISDATALSINAAPNTGPGT